MRVAEECKVAGIVEGREGRVLGLGADFTEAREMVALRETLVRGEFIQHLSIYFTETYVLNMFYKRMGRPRYNNRLCWGISPPTAHDPRWRRTRLDFKFGADC